MSNLFNERELLDLNEMMLGRGMPVQEDGVGYNKADYGACERYFKGCSNAQLADLAKRLVKYCNTQLGLDKADMQATHEHFAELAGNYKKEDGISLNITENGTLFSFRYNETFIEIIKRQPRRQWDAENKNWIVPNDLVIPTLNKLYLVGADVDNAMVYAMGNPLIYRHAFEPEVEIKAIVEEDHALLKFDYHEEVLSVIRKIDIKERQWNAQHKYWKIEKKHFENFKNEVSAFASFKYM